MTKTIILASLLSAPPSHLAPPEFADHVYAVDVTVSDTDAVITAHAVDGEPIGSLALWADDSGATWIAVDFSDGYAVFAVEPSGEIHRDATLDPDVVADRLDVMLAHGGALEHSWGECGLAAGGAAIGCAMARPLACVGGSIKAACACIPKIVKEFETYECPWGL